LVIAAALVVALAPQWISAQGEPMAEIETKGLSRAGDLPLTLIGPQLKVGQKLPDASVVNQDMKEVNISSFLGKVLIISTVPSLDTGVCSAMTRRFNQEAAALGDSVLILTISNDLPFAQKRFCGAEGIDRVVVLSDYRGQKFGRATGLFAKETYLLARSATVVDQKGIVRYQQIVPIQGNEPDYAPVLEAARKLLK
jgi:thiol peroxidase